jgi:hypothetical protein
MDEADRDTPLRLAAFDQVQPRAPWAKEKIPQQTKHAENLQMPFENIPAVCQNEE